MATGLTGQDKGMVKPQQPALPVGTVPEENVPGHRPEQDQDKPDGPPPRPRARKPKVAPAESVEGAATATITDRAEAKPEAAGSFKFVFENRVAPLSFGLGVTPWTTGLDVEDGTLRIRFGVWSLTTSLDNVVAAEVSGPYNWLKVAGPPRLSLADRGITFATTTKRGVCIKFRDPVSVLVPFLRHPAITVTVEDPDRLAELLTSP